MATIRSQAVAGDGVTIIGDSVQVRGNLSGDEDLHVLGRVDGRVDLQRTLVVAQSGIVKAEVSVKNAIISGVVVGNIRASESVEITKEGRMVGDIFSPRVIIVDGASFRGNVDMGDIANMPVRRPSGERPRPIPVPARATPAKTALPAPRPNVVAKAPDNKVELRADVRPAEARPAEARPAEARALPTQPDRPQIVARTPVALPTPAIPTEPPGARGLQQKQQKARVIVKRK